MMLCKADFDDLFAGKAREGPAGVGNGTLARWEDDGGLVADRPTGVIVAANTETRPALPNPAAALFWLALANANTMLGRYRRMTGR